MRHHLDSTAGGIAGLTGVDVASAGTGALVSEPISSPWPHWWPARAPTLRALAHDS